MAKNLNAFEFDDEFYKLFKSTVDSNKVVSIIAGRQTGKTMMTHKIMTEYLEEQQRIKEIQEVEDKLEQLGL